MRQAIDLRAIRRVHLIGIAGSGMSTLARWFLSQCYKVSGSDVRPHAALAPLARAGATVHSGHAAEHLAAPELVVVSAAIAADNPELVAARARGLAVLTHAQALGLLARARPTLAVAGTHGKTTTTALVGFLHDRAGRDPTILAGSELCNYPDGLRVGAGPLVVEADEYSHRFLELAPRTAIVTSVEDDHLDYFGDRAGVEAAFAAFAARLPPEGLLLLCADDPGARRVPARGRVVTYGLAADAAWRARALAPAPGRGMRFEVVAPDGQHAAAWVPLEGCHNVRNALAALAAVAEEGVPLTAAVAALAEFRGTRRRLELVGVAGGITVVDDYAHHPTAIAATLAAVRARWAGPLWVAFQPHTRHRTAALQDAFAAAFAGADEVVVPPTYEPAGREQPAVAISGADLAAKIRGPRARYVADLDAAAALLAAELPVGALLLTMGAGDINTLGPNVLARRERA